MAFLWQPSLTRASDSDGNPINGAKMYFYLTGTTTNAVYYLDEGGSSAGPHPISSNAAGIFNSGEGLFLNFTTIYRVKMTDSTGAITIFDVDGVSAFDPSQYGTSLFFETWADLEAVTGSTIGESAAVFDDSGTHTDPVTSATVPNEGLYGWTSDGWQWLSSIQGTFGQVIIDAPIAVTATDALEVNQTWNDGLLPGDGGRELAFHMSTLSVTFNPVNQIFDDDLHSVFRCTVSCDSLSNFSWFELNPPTQGVFSGGIMPPAMKISDPLVPGGTSYCGINYANGLMNLTQGIDAGTGRPKQVMSFYYDDFNPATGTGAYTTAVMRAYGSNRLQIQNDGGAIVNRNDNGRYEWESSAVTTRLSFVGYYLSDGKTIDVNNSGQVSGEARVPFSVSTVTTTVDTQLWSSLAGGTTWTNRAKMDGLGNLYTQSVWIGATIGAPVNSGAQGPTPVTNNDVNIARASAGVAQLTGSMIPEATGTRDLGSSANNWRRAYANAFVSSGNTQAAPATSHTGDTTETTLATFALPAGAMGPNGQIEVEAFVSMSGAASTKTLRVSFGGTTVGTFAIAAASTGQQSRARIANKTAGTQITFGAGSVSGYGPSTSASVPSSIDTTAAVTILITGQLANAADTITLESYLIKTTYGA